MSDREYFLLVDGPELKPGECCPGDAPELVAQTLEEILVSLDEARDFMAPLAGVWLPDFCVSGFYVAPPRSWDYSPGAFSVVVGWRWFSDGSDGAGLAGSDDVEQVLDVSSASGCKPDCSDLLDSARHMWVHKYPLLVTEENVLEYARFLYGSLPFDAGTVRLVPATEPMTDRERDLLEQRGLLGRDDVAHKG